MKIERDGNLHYIEFKDGKSIKPLKKIGKSNGNSGTEITFYASKKVFKSLDYDFIYKIYNNKNIGKGGSIKKAIHKSKGDIGVIYDLDLESLLPLFLDRSNSANIIPAATETFKDCISPWPGILTRLSQRHFTESERPSCSLPSTRTVGKVIFTEFKDSLAPGSAPTTHHPF